MVAVIVTSVTVTSLAVTSLAVASLTAISRTVVGVTGADVTVLVVRLVVDALPVEGDAAPALAARRSVAGAGVVLVVDVVVVHRWSSLSSSAAGRRPNGHRRVSR